MSNDPEPLVCATCQNADDLVIVGLDVAAMLGRYSEDNDAKWAVKCFKCGACYRINDETRDALFGTAWREGANAAGGGE